MHALTRLALALALVAPACGPGTDSTASDASTSVGPTSAETTDASAGTTASSAGTTTDAPTTGAPPDTTATDAETGDDPVPCPDDTIPPEGTPCAPDGATCDPFADPCQPYTSAVCIDGAWVHEEVGPGDPDECTDSCEPFPEDGQPCNVDGSFCNTGCTDQCSFCNAVMCSNGTWTALEVFPAPCLDCDPLCDLMLAPMCELGPSDKETCTNFCQLGVDGPCHVEFADARACAGDQMPTFSCDPMGRPTVAGCEPQFDAFYACLGF